MELWTADHARTLLPALFVMVIAAVLLRHLMGRKSERIRMLPIRIIAVILILLEIGKQAVSFSRGYDLYHIPLHYCSLFLFAVPAMAFYTGKHRNTVRAVASAFCASLLLFMLVYPNLIYGAYDIQNCFTDFLCFHTVTFHNLVLLGFFLILALELHTPSGKSEAKATVLTTGVFCVLSATMAQLLKTNYANFYQCNIPVFESLRTGLQPVLGGFLTQLLYVLIVAVLTVAFTLGAYWFYRLLKKLLGAGSPVGV